ncbi:bsl1941 [Bradyrhizobium diazoefficiens USDA 110]|uniref:Bsl1941 protein n=3 Tax=Bradyrhizobium diazoefficiens TaxID=1355477 RepID=Q89TJ6_BRADU|nr:hypothetical protein [Bradyrhizobium japonicum]KGJ67570.1 hypothetical protein BJA5080_07578 [Bradyrhizobium diazoefficiens SEMIA 5080]BAC47206.1 bsl1941 [Bradyrhizobium diazoefficiens USDA 110]BCE89151.1 hypothetical protein XF10B_19490 [Bradyrhizobium diazoefficiens]BCF24088.1 hypothetical protein XF14B_20400 [Bradyrhizobium diazoefficiens]BCF50461.1 hypothetical protein XF17B_20990 [Bradyrhizobium diazoefficiens]
MKPIARHLGCSHHTVKDYVAAGGVKPFKSPERPKQLDGLEGWLRERLIRHRGNADVGARTCWPSEAWQSAGGRCNAPRSPIARR